MTPSKIFLFFCLSFVGGIFTALFLHFTVPALLAFFIFGIAIFTILFQHQKAVVLGFCILFFGVGLWRQEYARSVMQNSELRALAEQAQVVSIVGNVMREPDIREKITQLTIASKLLTMNNIQRPISGKILVKTQQYPLYQYGDSVRVVGSLQAPQELESFNYPGYLAKDGIYSVMDFPKIERISMHQSFFTRITRGIFILKDRMRKGIEQQLSPPQSSILVAMLLGNQGAMTLDLKNKLNATGLSHVIAISGMHVVILSSIFMSLLVGVGFWRNQAFYIVLALVIFYIIFTGLQASAIRAGIMGALVLLGQKLGRKVMSARSLVMAGAFMLAFNPLLLQYDIGFQLSFLAVLGMIYFQPVFSNLLRFIQKDRFFGLQGILATTFAAQVFTLPVIVYNFGRISLIAPLTNVLILPVVYWIMVFGLALAYVGAFWQPIAWIFTVPSWFLLTYLVKVVDLFAQPWASKTIEHVHWIWLVFAYGVLAVCTYYLQRRFRFTIP